MVSIKEIKQKLGNKREGKAINGYLICKECGMQYKLKEGESAEDFIDCECGGELKEVENLENLHKTTDSKNNICQKCGTKNPYNAEFCIKCGQGLEENSNTQICTNCKKINPDTADFCIVCGNGLGEKANSKICSHCEAENPLEAQFCQKCGKDISPKTSPVTQIETPDGLSPGESVVICLFSPIAGAIAYLIWHDTKPKKANQSCTIAIVAFVIVLVFYILLAR